LHKPAVIAAEIANTFLDSIVNRSGSRLSQNVSKILRNIVLARSGGESGVILSAAPWSRSDVA